jgi:4-amino-4-deoxy-L-arabinose transferase-like glycosyltransferase
MSGYKPLERAVLAATFAAVVALGWVTPMRFGYWLDETGSYYFASSPWPELWPGLAHSVQSPLHSHLLWCLFHAGFTSEIALRVPSILAMLVAALLVYRVTVRLADRETAALAAVFFSAMPAIQTQAGYARTYAFAMVFGLAALLAYLRWTESQALRDMLLCGFFLSLTFYCHVLFVAAAVILATYSVWRIVALGDVRKQHLIVGAALYGILCIPILPYYLRAARNAEEFGWPGGPGIQEVLTASGLGLVSGALIITVGAAVFLTRKPRFVQLPFKDGTLAFLAAWCLAPIVVIYLYSRFGAASLLVDRYMLMIFAGQAVAFACLIRRFSPPFIRVGITCATALLLVVGLYGRAPWAKSLREDWREVLSGVREKLPSSDTVLLFHSGFIEAKSLARLQKPETLGFILAPLAAYPVQARIVAMPEVPLEGAAEYMQEKLDAVMNSERDFFFVGGEQWVTWLIPRVVRKGYDPILVSRSGRVYTYRFLRGE